MNIKPIFLVRFTAQKSCGGKFQTKMGADNTPICLELRLPTSETQLRRIDDFHHKHHASYCSVRAERYPLALGNMVTNNFESLNKSAVLIDKMDENTVAILLSRLIEQPPVCERELEELCKQLQ